jgi:hypothetical protein
MKHAKIFSTHLINTVLNFLERHLRLIQNAEYANTLIQIFIQSVDLVKDDKESSSKTL